MLLWGQSRKNKESQATTNKIYRVKEPLVKKARTATNVEEITIVCNEFSEVLEYIYFGNICDKNDDSEICNINFGIYDFNGQAINARTNCL